MIGVGYLGRFHAEKYARMADAELVGVVDVDAAAAERVARQWATEPFTDHRELLGKADAVSVVVPTPLHYQVSRDFLENAVDVLSEKPITTTLEEADELLALAEKRGLLIQVGHLERYNPAVVAIQGEIADPRLIEANRLSIYKERCTDVSVVLDLMIHDIDIILNMVRSEPVEIRASGVPVISGNIDVANARLAFANGAVASVNASRVSLKNERTIYLFQQDACIAVDFAARGITVIRPGDDPNNACPIPGMTLEQRSFNGSDALDDELKSFVDAVRHRREPEVTGKMGRDALKIALSVMEQIEAGGSRGSE